MTSLPGLPLCNPHADPPILGDCWYNCTSEDISGEDKKRRLHKVNFLLLLILLYSANHLIDNLMRKLLGAASVRAAYYVSLGCVLLLELK